jgi:hypothetical protein
LQNPNSFSRQGFQNNSSPAVFKVIQVAGVPKQLRYCRIQSYSNGRCSKTPPPLQYLKSFKRQRFQNNSAIAELNSFRRQGFQNNSYPAVSKVIQVAGVPKQLRYCRIQSYSGGRGSKTTPPLQYSKSFKRQGF